MDDEENSEISSDATDVSSSETGRTQQVVQQNVNINTVQKYQAVSNNRNVVFGDQVIKITKTDGRASIIKESTRLMLNSADRSVYVKTRAEERGVELLKKHGVVIVVGIPGSGKTTVALSMMTQIEKEEKRESYLLTHHNEFNDISLSENNKCIVLIDDIFGKTNLVTDFIDSWQLKFPKLWMLVQDGSLKCIITLRKQIFSESEISLKEFSLFNEKHVLDLQSDDCCLDYDEKKEILNKYLKQKKVTMQKNHAITVIKCSGTELGFPQVCLYYVNSSDAQKRGVEFFKNPVEYLRHQLEYLKNDKSSQINYLVLLLILFQQGSLSIDSLDPFENDTDSDIMKLVKLLERVCRGLKNTDLTDIKETADVMCGTYLKRCDNKYTFIHQSLFDSLFLLFSSKFPNKAAELLEVCPVSMLLEYVVTPGVSNKSHITMTVKPDCFDVLARRFSDLLASDTSAEIISHPSLKDEQFVKYLIEEKHFYGRLSEILHQRIYTNKYFYISSVYVNSPNEIFSNILCLLDNQSKFHSSCMRYLEDKGSLMYSSSVASMCVVGGLRTLSRFFTSNLCKMKLAYQKKELLDISCFFGDEPVVRMLLKSGVIPTFDTFSAAACSKTDSATILRELLQYKKVVKLNLCSHLLHICICSGNMNIACLLADMINNEKHNSEIKEENVKLLLLRFHRKVNFQSSNMCLENSDTIKVADISHAFKKLVTIDIINKIKDIAVIAAGQSTSSVIKEIVRLKPDCLNDENRDKVLLAAAIWGCCDTVNFLIEQRCNYTDENSWKKSQVLKVALIFNSADVVQCLLDKGADPNLNVAVNQKLIQFSEEEIKSKVLFADKTSLKLLPSDTPLHISVQRGDLDMIKSLIKRKADVNAVNSEGETPLHEAVKAVTHKKEVALLLLKNGADTNIADKQKNSALHIASQIDIDVVKEVIKKDVEINAINTKGETPLFQSMFNNRPEIALYLLQHGADPNLADNDKNSVFHLAAQHQNVEIVTVLIEKGLEVNIKNSRGETPLFTAVKHKQDKVVLYLLEHGADPNLINNDSNYVLHLAAKHGNIEIVTSLIEKDFDVNIKNNRGETPLFTAVTYKQNKIVLYLVEHGADPNLTDNDNNSVLHLAAEEGNIEIVTSLIDNDLDINIKNSEGLSPLHTAVQVGESKVVLFLLEHGADPHLTDNYNNSALHIAAEHGNTEIVTALTEKCFEVNIKNSQGETPLFRALDYFNQQFFIHPGTYSHINKLAFNLLEHGADPNLTDKENNSVLHLAAKWGNIELVTALTEKGFDVNSKNIRGETPLFTALNYFGILCYGFTNKVPFYLLEHGSDPNLTDKKK